MKRWLLLMALMGVWLVPSVTAQKAERDVRPLQGLNIDHLPRMGSVEAFLRARRPGTTRLRDHATVVGRAERVPMATQGRTRLGQAGAQGTPMWLQNNLRVARAANGTVRWMRGNLGTNAGKHTDAAVAAAYATLTQYSPTLGLAAPEDEFRLMRVVTDDLGYTHVRFEQVYDGVPVWARDLYVHFDETGRAYGLNGAYIPTPAGITTTASLPADAAYEVVVDHLKAEGRWAPPMGTLATQLGLDATESRLVLYPDLQKGLRLAHEVTLHPNFIEWYSFLIDAHDGTVLNRIARHCALKHDHGAPRIEFAEINTPPRKASQAGTFLDATALDLNGVNQSLRVFQEDDGTHFLIWDLPNIGTFQLPNIPEDGGAVTLDFAQDNYATSPNNVWTDASAVSAHANMNIAFTYYKQTHDRNAINDRDESILSFVHVTDEDGQPMDNAFWNGRVMAYGDGDVFFKPLAGALDVAGHEMTHGVIEHSAGLVYQFQSGALNES